MIAALVILSTLLAAAALYAISYAVYEWRWARRERLVRFGGPANRTLADRLAAYQIEPDHPEEHINLKEQP